MITGEVLSLSNNVIEIFQKAYAELKADFSITEKLKWMAHVNKTIQFLLKLLNNNNNTSLSIGLKKQLQTNIGHLKRFRILINKLSHQGAGSSGSLRRRTNRVIWQDVKTAFQKRIRTGIIINKSHKNVDDFFKDAFYLFKSRIKHVLLKIPVPVIKVNTTFCGQYILKKPDKETLEYKYFNTRNVLIDQGTNLNEWFTNNIQEISK